MLAEVVDAVVGIDTHRDIHVAELATPTGAPLATVQIPNTSAGYAELRDWIAQHTPGPRLAIAIEATRSYGIGVARALAASGLSVIESEQPARKARRGRCKSNFIDAHLAVLSFCVWATPNCPFPAPMAPAKRYGSCSAPRN